MVRDMAALFARCANLECASRPPYVGLRSKGVTLNNVWFCGVECFREHLLELVQSSRSNRPGQAAARSRLPLGLLLLSRGIISADVLRAALRMQQGGSRERLGNILRRMGGVKDSHITSARAMQWGCPVFPWDGRDPEPGLLEFIPSLLLRKYSMLPVHFVEQARSLYVAFGGELQYPVVRAMERAFAGTIVPCVVDDSVLQQSLGKLRSENEVVLSGVTGTGDMTRVITGYAETLRILSARVAQVGGDLWVRLTGRQQVDLIFDPDGVLPDSGPLESGRESVFVS